jgi:hypothetical protein
MRERRVMRGTLILTLFASVFMLLASSARAEYGSPAPDLLAAIFAATPGGACAQPEARGAAKPVKPVGPRTESVCTAHCWNGGTVTCTGTSCSAVDSACPGQRGSCWSNAEGTKYCPQCQQPQGCTASCANAGGGSVSCTSSTGDYFCVNNCYAYCDGFYYMCPNPKPICPF